MHMTTIHETAEAAREKDAEQDAIPLAVKRAHTFAAVELCRTCGAEHQAGYLDLSQQGCYRCGGV